MKKNINILYENQCLRNTNYYLLCTIYNLEKQKIANFNEFIKKTEEILIDKNNSIENELQFELEIDTNNNAENANDNNDTNYLNDDTNK